MKLESQVCSLDLSKRLKELGVKQDSVYFWKHEIPAYDSDGPFMLRYGSRGGEEYSAFTVAELGEMLPVAIDGKFLSFDKFSTDPEGEDFKGWFCGYSVDAVYTMKRSGQTISDAGGKMLIHLIENKLVNP